MVYGKPKEVDLQNTRAKFYKGTTPLCSTLYYALDFGEHLNCTILLLQRITVPEIIEDEWFQKDYVPICVNESEEEICFEDVNVAFDSIEVESIT